MAQQLEQQIAGNPAVMYERHFVPAIFGPWAAELLRRVAPRPGERVLDLACGTGAVARQAAPIIGATGSIVGLDLSSGMLQVARALPPPAGASITWLEGPAEALPFPEAEFDAVFCQQGLQFSPDRPAVAREMRRVLRPGGRAGISVWQGIDQQPVIAAFDSVTERYLGTPSDNTPFSFGSAESLRKLLDDAGFREVVIEPVTRPVRFPARADFVRLTVLAAAAVVPDFDDLDEPAQDALVEAISRDMDPTLRAYQDGDGLAFPMTANVALATA